LQADPAARAADLAPLIEEETFALARVDMTRIDVNGLARTLTALLPSRKDELSDFAKKAKEFHAAFTKAGGTELVIAFSTEELPDFSLVHVPLAAGSDAAALTALLKRQFGDKAVVEKRGAALVAGQRAAVARLGKGKPSQRPDLVPAVTAAGDSAIQVVLLPTADQRKVVDEVVNLPLPGGSGKSFSRGVRWAALGLDLAEKPAARLTIQSADEAAAKKLDGVVAAGLAELGKMSFVGDEKPLKDLMPKEFAAAQALRPSVAGNRLTVRVSDLAVLKGLLSLFDAIEERKDGIERTRIGSNLHNILIALINYHDTFTTFPPHAIYSKDGKPLLSWRVAILPFIEQDNLYKQFKLDEPWDSAHNKKLIDKMPKLYRSPKIQDKRAGLTTYVAPIHKDFLFTGTAKGLQFKDITDGTSNTAILVDVADEAGVIWTKPDDLVVSQKDPWKGILGHYPGFALFGMADASVRRIPKTVAGKTLWALFTRNGGEVIPDLTK
jgi:hypothetical protein